MEQRQELRKAGLKVTLPRLKILEIFEKSRTRHMSAEDMYKELLDSGEDIGLATVYRVLTQFEAAGLFPRDNFEGGHSVFELDDGDHHDHMVCVETGDVIEFSNEEIEHLMRFFTIAEQLPGWHAADNSPVIWLGKLLKQRGVGINKELVLWIKENSDNRFLPHGPLI